MTFSYVLAASASRANFKCKSKERDSRLYCLDSFEAYKECKPFIDCQPIIISHNSEELVKVIEIQGTHNVAGGVGKASSNTNNKTDESLKSARKGNDESSFNVTGSSTEGSSVSGSSKGTSPTALSKSGSSSSVSGKSGNKSSRGSRIGGGSGGNLKLLGRQFLKAKAQLVRASPDQAEANRLRASQAKAGPQHREGRVQLIQVSAEDPGKVRLIEETLKYAQ